MAKSESRCHQDKNNSFIADKRNEDAFVSLGKYKRKSDKLFECFKLENFKKCSDLIILGLPWKTLKKEPREYFEPHDEVLRAQVENDPKTGQSKGFGFIRYESYEVQQRVLGQRCMIDDRVCDVKIPNSKKGTMQQLNSKVFTGRCTEDISADDIREYFNKFGEIPDVYIPKPFRAFTFVIFVDPVVAQSLCGEDYIIKGTSIHMQVVVENINKRVSLIRSFKCLMIKFLFRYAAVNDKMIGRMFFLFVLAVQHQCQVPRVQIKSCHENASAVVSLLRLTINTINNEFERISLELNSIPLENRLTGEYISKREGNHFKPPLSSCKQSVQALTCANCRRSWREVRSSGVYISFQFFLILLFPKLHVTYYISDFFSLQTQFIAPFMNFGVHTILLNHKNLKFDYKILMDLSIKTELNLSKT
ncbi:TAR DNA-binding protein 43 [Armadillidium vulgare]|nr:TAR DNA-binding protein 43 [Armadillidium vulgare]